MFRKWLGKNIAAASSGVAIVLVAALVITVAVASGGYSTERTDLDNASVWVVSDAENALGRLNTQIDQLDTATRTGGQTGLTALQNNSQVLLFSHDKRELSIVDEALASFDEKVQMPTDADEVYLAGKALVIFASTTGQVWFVPLNGLDTFSAEVEADLTLGKNATVAVDDNGVFAGYSVSQGLIRMDLATSTAPEPATVVALGEEDDAFQSAVVAGKAVIFNEKTGTLSINGADPVKLDLASDSRLMASAPLAEDIYVSDSRGLTRISLTGSSPERVFSDGSGASARTTVEGSCVFAAWTDGSLWRDCAGKVTDQKLDGLDGEARLNFASRYGYVLLNDEVSGRAWMVQKDGQLVDNWKDILQDIEDNDKQEVNDPTLPPEVDPVQKPPQAEDDIFGARPGRTTTLPVLLNDYDPNGDVIMITSVSEYPEGMGSVAVTSNGQYLQVTIPEGATQDFTFRYTISDGFGGTDSANVTVQIRQPHENGAPEQKRPSTHVVTAGDQFSRAVLTDWVDPDGDPIYLLNAETDAPDRVTYSAKGVIYFQDSDSGSTSKTVTLTVSDGKTTTTGTLNVEVTSTPAPIVADGIAAVGHENQEVTVHPLDYVRGGNGLIRITGVPDDKLGEDATVKVNSETGEVRFTAKKVGTYMLEYKVSDGSSAVSGTLRYEISETPAKDLPPITTPSSAFLYLTQTDSVDVLGTDIDPAGGVLMINSITNPLEDKGLIVEVLNHGMMRVSLSEPIPDGQIDIPYSVTNGYQTVGGVLTVIQIDPPAKEKPPVAVGDRAKARVNEVIEIPVLDNDIHPDGMPLTLRPDLARDINEGGGLLFVSGTKLRYLAPDKPGEFYATYIVETPGGEMATAVVQISVRELDAESNSAPAPKTVTARAVQGQKIHIAIPLSGIDDDGDSVTLGGTESAPELGITTATGKDYIEYEAGPTAVGTDVFYYSVTDSLGARGNGQIRVGVMPAATDTSNPIAATDLITVRPGTKFAIKPLDNDSDPDGGVLTVVGVEKSEEVPTSFTEETVTISVPDEEGTYPVLYTIQNETGGQSSAWIQVSVRKDAPPTRPIVDDTVLNLTDISKEKERLDIDVWNKVFYAEGTAKDLTISAVTGWDSNIQVTDKKMLSVAVTDKNQIIPFRIAVTDDPEVFSYGFVWVPGFKSAVPERRSDAKPLTIPSGEKLTINLADQVIAAEGKKVRITDASTVKLTNANGSNAFRNDTTLEFVSADKYSGPASVMFTATDAAPGETGNEATITLPITVTPTDNNPPTLRGASFTLEPTGTRTLDLMDLTTYPYRDALDELEWSLPADAPQGLSVAIAKSTLTVKANNSIALGTVNVTVGVKDKKSAVAEAQIAVDIVKSTKEKVQPQPDTVEIRRGETKTVNVLANDIGPAELKPFTVTRVDDQNTVEGVTAAVSADKQTITVTATAEASISANLQLTYRVMDATMQPDREVTGTVSVVVVDVPDRPGAPRYLKQDSFQNDGNLRLSFTASPSSNGKPVERYIVRSTDGAVNVDCGLDNSSCTVTGAQAGVGVKRSYTVIAVNSVGESAPSDAGPPLRIDYVPDAPTNLTAVQPAASSEFAPVNGGTLNISWSPSITPNKGTPANEYLVVVTQDGGDVKFKQSITSGTSVTVPNLEAASHTVTVTAKNNIETETYGAISWKTATVNGAAAKKAPTMAPMTFTSVEGSMTASYPAAANGGSVPTYHVVWGGEPSTCAAAKKGSTATSSKQDFNSSTMAKISVTAWNGWACVTIAGQQQYWQKPEIPGAPSIARATEFSGTSGAELGLVLTAPSAASAPGVLSYYYTVGEDPSRTQAVLVKPGQVVDVDRRLTIANKPNKVWLKACATSDGNVLYCSSYGPASTGLPLNLAVTTDPAKLPVCKPSVAVETPFLTNADTLTRRWIYVLRDGREVERLPGQYVPGSAVSMTVWVMFDRVETPEDSRLSFTCSP